MRNGILLAVSGLVLFASNPAFSATGEADNHPELTGAIRAFHDVLKIDWHADEGAARNNGACGNIGDYITLAREVTKQNGPGHAAPREWQSASHGLLDASVALGAYCASGADGNVTSGLTTLHDRFHDVMALLNAPE